MKNKKKKSPFSTGWVYDHLGTTPEPPAFIEDLDPQIDLFTGVSIDIIVIEQMSFEFEFDISGTKK